MKFFILSALLLFATCAQEVDDTPPMSGEVFDIWAEPPKPINYDQALEELEEDPTKLDEIIKELGIDLEKIEKENSANKTDRFALFQKEKPPQNEIFSADAPTDPFSIYLFTDFLSSMVSALEAMEEESDAGFLDQRTAPSEIQQVDSGDSFFSPLLNLFPMMGAPMDGEFVEIETTTVNGVTQTRVSKSVTKNGVTTTTTEITTNQPHSTEKVSEGFELVETNKSAGGVDTQKVELDPQPKVVEKELQVVRESESTQGILERNQGAEQMSKDDIQKEYVQTVDEEEEKKEQPRTISAAQQQKTVKVSETKSRGSTTALAVLSLSGLGLLAFVAFQLRSRSQKKQM